VTIEQGSMKIHDNLELIVKEFRSAEMIFKPFASAHEGISIIREEFEEMWDAVRDNDLEDARTECVQLAAMALRFLFDVTTQQQFANTRTDHVSH